MDLEPHIADGDDAEEALGAIRAALLGLQPDGPIHFAPEKFTRAGCKFDLETSWGAWLGKAFIPLVAPHLISVREAFPGLAAREIVQSDRDFTTLLDPATIDRSLRAGRALREALVGSRHRPELDRIFSLLDRGDRPEEAGHFSTLFAARCASHHVPLTSTLAAYLYFEFKSASPAGADIPSSRILALVQPGVRGALESRPAVEYRVA